ncbi:MAG: hypothetical protein COT71_00305 [Candidatus Andersenbacteria bacterium CG10_big_fil_rev_8_21_14_0_10_54_11]|uniref:Uncharacterized protein n=1 Tax=Candidatus Andersenbacteria bacterium CG10_big_fil_rev_8_21_14_0_10_54_11 TaxID=1974485 RepID=A0A2M6X0J4_9BACT|nr:MAG: hypothetical protein COT71_00305 [Candidatus Andersenbacteria bacterium CG10_big_fil_rev_8_21_14_0_10_54_11]
MVLVVVLVAGFLIFLSVLASQVGGLHIRSASQTVPLGTLTSVQTTLVPGAPTAFQTRLPGTAVAAWVVLRFADATVPLRLVSEAEMQRGTVSLTVPCRGSFLEGAKPLRGRVVLSAAANGAVLAQSDVFTVLPAGPDCFFGGPVGN